MSRIIKSYEVKAKQDELQKKTATLDAEDEASVSQGGSEAADWEERRAAMEAAAEADFQAAYDELIAAAQDEVGLMLQDARAEAAHIVAEAQQTAEAQFRGAYEEGYRLGLDDSRQAVMGVLEQAEADVEEMARQANAERDRMLAEAEPKLMGLSIDIARKILGLELDRDDEAYRSMVSQALGQVRGEGAITLRVNPDEYTRFFNDKLAEMQTPNGPRSVEVLNDSSVPVSGCLIDTDSGSIDAGMEAQLSQIADSLGFSEEE